MAGVLRLLVNQRPAEKPHIDIARAVGGTAGLFSIVFGLAHAETAGWTDPITLGWLCAGVVLFALFVAIEARAIHPLLLLRVLADRNRGASFLTITMAAVALFGTFLFLTFYLQAIEGYSPIQTGAAFLPLTLTSIAVSSVGSPLLWPRVSPRWTVTGGMMLGAIAMLNLTRLDVNSTYAAGVLPTLLPQGLGLGLVFTTATNNAVVGVRASDSGVASAIANACSQIGGSVGTALLSTIAAGATISYSRGLAVTPLVIARASVHGYVAAWAWSASISAAGALVALALYRSEAKSTRSMLKTDVAAENAGAQ